MSIKWAHETADVWTATVNGYEVAVVRRPILNTSVDVFCAGIQFGSTPWRTDVGSLRAAKARAVNLANALKGAK